MHPQSPVLTISYPQDPKDPRPNFEKYQNSGADLKTVTVHNSTYLSIFYPYLNLSLGSPSQVEDFMHFMRIVTFSYGSYGMTD